MEKELVWTNEDAIKMLKSKMDGHTDTSYEWVETVRLAINALEGKKKREMTNEQAIEILANARYADDLQGNEDLTTAHYMAIEALKSRPTSRWSRQTTGKWERFVDDYNKCSNCGVIAKFHRNYNYCPNCGAKMAESEVAE